MTRLHAVPPPEGQHSVEQAGNETRAPVMLHIAGFSPNGNLCGGSADPLDSIEWSRDERTVDCVVCAATWHAMTYEQRRALNIFWGGNA